MSKHDFKRSLELYLRLFSYLKPHKVRAFIGLFCMVLSAGATAAFMYQLKPIIDGTFLKTDDPVSQYNHLFYFTIPITVLLAVFRYSSGYVQSYFTNYLGQRVVQGVRRDLYVHFLRLPMSYFNSNRTGGLASRITTDVVSLQSSITNVVGQGLSSFLTAISLIGLLFYLDWELALSSMVVFPLVLLPVYRYGRKIRTASGEGYQALSDLNAQVHETLTGIRIVKAFSREEGERARFNETNEKYFSINMRTVRAYALSSPIVEMITTVVLLCLILWLAHRRLTGQDLTPGFFTAFIAATMSLYPQLKNFNNLWGTLQSALAAAERCFEVLDTPNALPDAPDAIEVKPLRKSLEFQDVSFEYIPGHPVLRNVSFSIKKGEVVALVGPSGGGKTTLVDLIPRFYQPTSGAIYWDGTDLAKVKASSLRLQIGIVTQETILFHDSILHNITYGKPEAGFGEVQKAAEAAHAHEFIRNTPQGYNTIICDRGTRLSGGQRQRLAIARAILRNPGFMILDEATSALDTESEQLVQEALDELMKDRTTLVIAHRLSTIRKADRILVVEKGRIVEQGKHEDLLRKKGLYAKLHRIQFRQSPVKVKA